MNGQRKLCVCIHIHMTYILHTHTHIYAHNGILLSHEKKEILPFATTGQKVQTPS